ncbi:uncharacterized protein [Euphorbia lathyris]|uniref:uncharacterized protein n=1 Tax=Euphorbia lathyris TaxID=212925 RepID=UPI00331415E1
MEINARTARKTPKTETTENSLNRKEAPAAAVSPLEEEDIDLNKQFIEEDNCFWLSSPSPSSPSSFFQEYNLSSSLRLTVDDWLISWLSTLADTYLHLDNSGMKKKNNNSETDFQEVSDSENSKFSSDEDGNSEYSYSDGVDLEDFRAEEPLFWPSDSKSDWNSPEIWNCFSMSPRKGLATSDSSTGESKFGVLKFDSRRRSLEFHREASRLGNLTKIDEEIVIEEESIETVMGLGEFDGHEGVEYEFNEDVFSMDDDV